MIKYLCRYFQIMRGLGLNGTVKEAFDVIRNDSGFYYDTGVKYGKMFIRK